MYSVFSETVYSFLILNKCCRLINFHKLQMFLKKYHAPFFPQINLLIHGILQSILITELISDKFTLSLRKNYECDTPAFHFSQRMRSSMLRINSSMNRWGGSQFIFDVCFSTTIYIILKNEC